MLRILLMSDLHGAVPQLPAFNRNNYDAVILAGDLTNGTKVESRIDVCIQKLAFLGAFYFLQGNSDYPALVEMNLSQKNAISLHKNVIRVGDYEILGSGGATTGLINYSAFSEAQFERNLREVFASAKATPNHQILVTHDPPFNTALDLNLRQEHVGSRSVRHIIEEKQPLLALCGHIHEARGIEKIHATTCVNSGAVKLGNGGAEILIDQDTIQVKWLDL